MVCKRMGFRRATNGRDLTLKGVDESGHPLTNVAKTNDQPVLTMNLPEALYLPLMGGLTRGSPIKALESLHH